MTSDHLFVGFLRFFNGDVMCRSKKIEFSLDLEKMYFFQRNIFLTKTTMSCELFWLVLLVNWSLYM